jgi:tetratricopeptide (TPR) repeat protein
MVSCKQCATSNSLDSVFCKRCGAILAEDQVEEARLKLEALLKEGLHSFNEGRTDEALAIAETALVSDPNSIVALSLAADSHVRKGQVAQALELMERVVELNPDSELDKIKRNQLRSQLMTRLHVDESGDSRLALTAAIAAGIIVICLGAIWANYASRASAANDALVSRNPSAGSNPITQNTASITNPNFPPAGQTANNQPAPQPDASPGDVQPIRSDRENSASGTNDGLGSLPKYKGPVLPLPTGSDNSTVQISPINPMQGSIPSDRPGVVVSPRTTSSESKPSNLQDPAPDTAAIDTAAPTTPERDTGVYDIAVSHPGSRPGKGRDDGPTAGGAEALMRTGVQQYQLGSYASAAGTLERALNAGADPVSVNQRLGQAYEKLGKANDAASAYKRAISAGESAISSGRGNKDRIQVAIDVCRQALRVIQGN